MAKDTSSASEDWLLLLIQLSGDDPAVRMRALRTLESLGAAVVREGAYLLPDSPSSRTALDHLAEYIVRNSGLAHVVRAHSASPAQQDAFSRLFDRSGRYDELVKVVNSLRLGFGVSDPGAISRVLHKQRKEFESISALDFFPSAARDRASEALTAAEAEVRRLLFPQKTGTPLKEDEKLLGRTWATRRPLWADRLACAWLIRRFVDPEARIEWLEKNQAPSQGAVGFAFDGAHFANTGERVSFEEMLRRLDFARNAALGKIGGIVRYLEIQGDPVPEAAGVQTLLQGAARRATSDNELLQEAEKTFDLIYEAYFDPAQR